MPRPLARFTETYLKRAIKAAKAAGGDDMAVRVLPDGSIEIYRKLLTPEERKELAPKRVWVT